MSQAVAALIGPNAVIQVAKALDAVEGRSASTRIFGEAGIAHYLERPPETMIAELDVVELHHRLRAGLGERHSASVSWVAGHHTANYLLANRIPAPVQHLLRTAAGAPCWAYPASGDLAPRLDLHRIRQVHLQRLQAGAFLPSKTVRFAGTQPPSRPAAPIMLQPSSASSGNSFLRMPTSPRRNAPAWALRPADSGSTGPEAGQPRSRRMPYPILRARPGQRRCRKCPNLTLRSRVQRLTNGRSTDRMSRPRGTIQKPRTGRNPRSPKNTRSSPMPIRRMGCPGSFILYPTKLTRDILRRYGGGLWLFQTRCPCPEKLFSRPDASAIRAPSHSPIAQLVEHSTVNRMVAGSSPARGASFKAGLRARPFLSWDRVSSLTRQQTKSI